MRWLSLAEVLDATLPGIEALMDRQAPALALVAGAEVSLVAEVAALLAASIGSVY